MKFSTFLLLLCSCTAAERHIAEEVVEEVIKDEIQMHSRGQPAQKTVAISKSF